MMNRPDTVNILGIPVHNVTREETMLQLLHMARSQRAHHVVTVNPEFIMLARRDQAFRNILLNASLAVPDGVGVILASRLKKKRIAERVTGVDTIRGFARVARDNGLSLFLLGAAPGVAERTAQVLLDENPGLKIAGTFAGSPHPDDEEEICRRIESARPDVLYVAYGPPRQDLWIDRTRKRLKVPVAVGVGGSFDFIAGETQRAPLWMQRAGLEWLDRLLRQPWRWRRMLALPHYALLVIRESIAQRKNERQSPERG